MPTLYVENVPEDIYQALRKQARKSGTSIAVEVIALLKQFVPTAAELKRRQKAFEELRKLRGQPPLGPAPFPSAEEMIREERDR